MNYILNNRLRFYTKEAVKILSICTIALFIIMTIVCIKYSPIYEVTLNGKTIGYVKNKDEFEEKVNKEVLSSDNPCAVFTTLDVEPVYEFKLANVELTDEEQIIEKLSENTTTMYKVYAITLGDETESIVESYEEAEEIVNEMNEEYGEITDNIAIVEKYTEDFNNAGTVQLAEAKASIDTDLRQIKDEQERIASATLNGVYFAVKPVTGSITSRYGVVESSVRDHAHGGLDIAAPYGTNIKAAADGEISYADWMGGYGNLIIIDHENGVQTYYGHCSKLYASVGQKVTAGDIIAAVGSTGNSTGNHLHLEIRLNGVTLDPQKYLYK